MCTQLTAKEAQDEGKMIKLQNAIILNVMLFILSSCLVKADNEIEEYQGFLDEGEITYIF